jgi:DNA-binding IclR family transcriptional regulator
MPNKLQIASEESDPLFVTVLARGLAVLRCFTKQTPELGTSDIAKMLKLPQPTVWRLCYTLRELGYLTQARNGKKLRLGAPVLGLGYSVLAGHDIATLAHPYMEELAGRFGESVSLSMLDGTDIIFIQRCEVASLIYSGFPVGARSSVVRAPAGWAMLAGMRPQHRNAIIKQLKATDPTAWTKAERHIAVAVEEFKELGFVTSVGKGQSEFHAVSAPIYSALGEETYALTCVGLRSQFPVKKMMDIGPSLARVADIIAMALKP